MSKRINSMFFMRPWAIKKEIFDVMNEVFDRFNRGEKLTAEEIVLRTGDSKKTSPDFEIVGSTAFIPIYGIIAKRASMVNGISMPSGTSIEEIRKDFLYAMNDDKVDQIVLDIDSPGGSVDGVNEMADLIYNARGKKPITAYADGMMASAAYWIGSAADKIFASKSSDVGSIGVYAAVYDWSVAVHNMGVKTEIFKAGRNKAAGHPHKPMTEEDRAVIQEEIDDIYELFIEAVGRNRGMSLEESVAVATGRVYIGKKAMKLGLIDGIQNLDVERERASGAKSGKSASQDAGVGADNIDDSKNTNKNQQEVVDMELKELNIETLKAERPDLHDAVFAEGKSAGIKEGEEKGRAEGKAEGVKEGEEKGKGDGITTGIDQERARILSIMDSAKAIPVQGDMMIQAIKDGTKADVALNQFKDAHLETIKAGSPASPGISNDGHDVDTEGMSLEEKCKKEWETKADIRKEFASLETYTGWRRAESKGRVKITGSRK